MNKKWALSLPLVIVGVFLLAVLLFPGGATAQHSGPDVPGEVSWERASVAQVDTTFIYQGELTDNGSPANGVYDFQFSLHDALVGGTQVGLTLTVDNLTVIDGLFTAALDFGNVFIGRGLWLNITVRPGGSTGAYTTLTPRQPLTATPYAASLVPGALISGTSSCCAGVLNLTNTGDALVVDSIGGNGVNVGSAGNDGVHVGSPGRMGVFVDQPVGSGYWVNLAGTYGVNAAGSILSGYFLGNIEVTGSCTGCLLATFGINNGSESLHPGDLVTIEGVVPSGVDSVPILMEVASAKAGQNVVGVVGGWAELIVEEEIRPTEIGLRLIPREGVATPGAFVTIIYNGPVQVKAGFLDGSITPGVRLTVANTNGVRPLQTTEVNGIQIAESTPIVGIALSEPDPEGLVWVLVNPQ